MTKLTACRSCGEKHLQAVLSLGAMPLANALLTIEQLQKPELTFPLDLAFCPKCSLVQITETVPPELLFTNYVYFSSFSETTLRDSRELAEKLIESRHLGNTSLVVVALMNANVPFHLACRLAINPILEGQYMGFACSESAVRQVQQSFEAVEIAVWGSGSVPSPLSSGLANEPSRDKDL